MRDPVALVQAVGQVESLHHQLDPLRTVDRQLVGVAAGGPALQQQFAQSADVVGVEVRQERAVNLCGLNAHQRRRARPSFANVHHERVAAGDDQHART